jgi:hypothetical protein
MARAGLETKRATRGGANSASAAATTATGNFIAFYDEIKRAANASISRLEFHKSLGVSAYSRKYSPRTRRRDAAAFSAPASALIFCRLRPVHLQRDHERRRLRSPASIHRLGHGRLGAVQQKRQLSVFPAPAGFRNARRPTAAAAPRRPLPGRPGRPGPTAPDDPAARPKDRAAGDDRQGGAARRARLAQRGQEARSVRPRRADEARV